MRLIDADALKDDFECVGFNDYDDYNRALRIIDNAPTVELQMGRMTNGIVIPIERPTGKWIFDGHNSTDKDEIYCCSECYGKLHTTADKLFNYCPHCGAKMKWF